MTDVTCEKNNILSYKENHYDSKKSTVSGMIADLCQLETVQYICMYVYTVLQSGAREGWRRSVAITV